MSTRAISAVRSIVLAGGAVMVSTGCFAYVPVQVETVPVGQEVRLTLSRQGRFELPEELELEGTQLSGTLVRRDAEQLYVNVPIGRREQGFYVSQIEREVGVRSREIVEVELRKLSRSKTAAFVAGTAAAAAAVVYVIIEATSRSTDDRVPGNEEFRIPLFSIPVR